MIWFHDGWTLFNDAMGALGLHDGASPAYTYLFTLVVAQYRFGTFGFFSFEREAQSTKISQQGQLGFEDQHLLMIWLQDNAAALSLSKVSAILVGHDMGGQPPCHHLVRLPGSVDFKVPFAAVIMQSGFCDDIKAA
jgi:carboxylesterase type B